MAIAFKNWRFEIASTSKIELFECPVGKSINILSIIACGETPTYVEGSFFINNVKAETSFAVKESTSIIKTKIFILSGQKFYVKNNNGAPVNFIISGTEG